MTVFGTMLIIILSSMIGWNKKMQDSTKIIWFVIVAVMILLYILGKIFS